MIGEYFKTAQMRRESQSSAESLTLMMAEKKLKKNPQNKVWFGDHRSNTHTQGFVQYANSHTHNLWYTEAFFLPPSLLHTCTHTNLHSLIWADSGNRSSELAGGPGRGGGGAEKRGDQSEDESSRLAEKKQQKREERRKESFEREEKRKENFLCS